MIPQLPLLSSLGQFETNVSPWHNPSGWRDASRAHIVAVVHNFSDPGLAGALERFGLDLVGTTRIYERLFVYTFFLCAQEPRLLDGLLEATEIWKTWDEVETLTRHQNIVDFLWLCIQAGEVCQSARSLSDTRQHDAEIDKLQRLDMAGLSTYIAEILRSGKHFMSNEAQMLIDLLQGLLDYNSLESNSDLKKMTYTALWKLCKQSGCQPTCLPLLGVNLRGGLARARGGGGYGDVYKEDIKDHTVAVKAIRCYPKDLKTITKVFTREALIWAQLSHTNILPFYGTYHLQIDDSQRLCLISPWMDFGTITEYIKSNPDVNRAGLLLDVACGLQYMHTLSVVPIVHGDLKGANILINSVGRACLADFGLSTIDAITDQSYEIMKSTTTIPKVGTFRWLAPELLEPEDDGSGNRYRPTPATDIYALGIVAYEIFSGKIPFDDLNTQYQVMTKITKGEHPSCPAGLSDNVIWKLVERCWHGQPQQRPTAAEVVSALQPIAHPQGDTHEQEQRDESFMSDVRVRLEKHPFHLLSEKTQDVYVLLMQLLDKFKVPDVFFTIIPDHLREHKHAICCIGFPPSSSETSVSDTIVSCSKDGTTCKWFLEEKKVVIRPMLSDKVDKFGDSVAVAMSHDCKRISSNIQSRLPRKSRFHLGKDMGIWNVETGRLLFNPVGDQPFTFDAVSFSKDDTQMVAASRNGFHLWDVKAGGKVVGPFQMGWQISHSTSFPIYSVAFAHNDNLILSGLRNGFINITDIKHPYRVSRCIGHCHSAPVFSIAVKQDKDQFVSGSKDGTVIVWNLEQKQIGPFTICWVAEGHQKFKCSNDPIKSVTVSPNNDLVAAGLTNGIVMIWDLNKLDGVPHVCIGNESGVRCISFAHDMKQIASGHENGIICVWKI